MAMVFIRSGFHKREKKISKKDCEDGVDSDVE